MRKLFVSGLCACMVLGGSEYALQHFMSMRPCACMACRHEWQGSMRRGFCRGQCYSRLRAFTNPRSLLQAHPRTYIRQDDILTCCLVSVAIRGPCIRRSFTSGGFTSTCTAPPGWTCTVIPWSKVQIILAID